MSFFWYQKTGGSEAWHVSDSQFRDRIIAEKQPAFVTVLDADAVPDDTWGREEFSKLLYFGPLYFDWDAADVNDAISDINKFLTKLESEGVDLSCLRIYATGGKGFHVEIPPEVFNPKPKKGVALLPYIYRDMAQRLATESMDMRVYTGRRGRMWRTPGVQRDSGAYKVPVTAAEVREMSLHAYAEICSAPRTPPTLATPEPNPFLVTLFNEMLTKTAATYKAVQKSKKDEEILRKLGNKVPQSVQMLMAGVGTSPDRGFHQIAMQLAIFAHAVGMTEDTLLTNCEHLCQSHQSDSHRYNSPKKRKSELRRMYEYIGSSDMYAFSVGGLRAIAEPGFNLDDISMAAAMGVTSAVPTAQDVEEHKRPAATEDEQRKRQELDTETGKALSRIREGVFIRENGVFKMTENGPEPLTQVGFAAPKRLIDADDCELVGFDLTVFSGNEQKPQMLSMPITAFRSRVAFNDFCMARGAFFKGTDVQASIIHNLLHSASESEKDTVYALHREGIDVVQSPHHRVPGQRIYDVAWVSPERVAVIPGDEKVQTNYRFMSRVAAKPVFNADLHSAAKMRGDEDEKKFIEAMLNMNGRLVIGQILGWLTSCFHKQFYTVLHKQFPLLHCYGPAGSGKSQTMLVLSRMHYNVQEPMVLGCSSNATTSFFLKSAWSSSASLPVVLDEYKPSEIGPIRHDFLLQHFRMLYNQQSGGSGGMSRGGVDSTFRDTARYTYSAPTAYVGEAQEMQTAVMQRSVCVAFSQDMSAAGQKNYDYVLDRPEFIGRIGATLLELSCKETLDSIKARFAPYLAWFREHKGRNSHPRLEFNQAVILAGLDYLRDAIAAVHGKTFAKEFDEMREAIIANQANVGKGVVTEHIKVLTDMAYMSRAEDDLSDCALREGVEYLYVEGGLELQMKDAFVKYQRWCRKQGDKTLFAYSEAFNASLLASGLVKDANCHNSPLKLNPSMKVFRIDLEQLVAEDFEPFASKHLA